MVVWDTHDSPPTNRQNIWGSVKTPEGLGQPSDLNRLLLFSPRNPLATE